MFRVFSVGLLTSTLNGPFWLNALFPVYSGWRLLQGTWETSKTTSQDHPSRHPQKTARIVPGERRRQDRQADGGGLLVWRCETSADDCAEQGGRGTEHFARVRAGRPQAGPVACAEVISNYNYNCLWTYKPQADFCLLSFSTYSKWDENVCFSAKRSLTECCVCNIGILWKNKKSLVFTVTWLVCSSQVIVVTARDVQERNWNLIFSYLEVSIHILEWICCILQSSDVCTSLKLAGRKWKQLWTLLFVLPLSAGCSCLSCCRTHKYYPRPAAPSWPLGYHEFYSNGSCCDHFSFISLIHHEHRSFEAEKETDIEYQVHSSLSVSFFSLATIYQLLTDAFDNCVHSSVRKQGLIWLFHLL